VRRPCWLQLPIVDEHIDHSEASHIIKAWTGADKHVRDSILEHVRDSILDYFFTCDPWW